MVFIKVSDLDYNIFAHLYYRFQSWEKIPADLIIAETKTN